MIEEELRRHAIETNPRSSCYQLGRPPRTHVNGIRLAPWRYLLPGFRRTSDTRYMTGGEDEPTTGPQPGDAAQDTLSTGVSQGPANTGVIQGPSSTSASQGISSTGVSQGSVERPRGAERRPPGREIAQPGPSSGMLSEAHEQNTQDEPLAGTSRHPQPAADTEESEFVETVGKGKNRAADVGTRWLNSSDSRDKEKGRADDTGTGGSQSVDSRGKGKNRAEDVGTGRLQTVDTKGKETVRSTGTIASQSGNQPGSSDPKGKGRARTVSPVPRYGGRSTLPSSSGPRIGGSSSVNPVDDPVLDEKELKGFPPLTRYPSSYTRACMEAAHTSPEGLPTLPGGESYMPRAHPIAEPANTRVHSLSPGRGRQRHAGGSRTSPGAASKRSQSATREVLGGTSRTAQSPPRMPVRISPRSRRRRTMRSLEESRERAMDTIGEEVHLEDGFVLDDLEVIEGVEGPEPVLAPPELPDPPQGEPASPTRQDVSLVQSRLDCAQALT